MCSASCSAKHPISSYSSYAFSASKEWGKWWWKIQRRFSCFLSPCFPLFCHLCLLALLGLAHITAHCWELGCRWQCYVVPTGREALNCVLYTLTYAIPRLWRGRKHDLEIAVQRSLSLRKENVSCHTQSLQIHLGSTGCRLSFRVGAHLDAWKSRTELCSSSKATLGTTLETFSLHHYHCLYFSAISEKLIVHIPTSPAYLGCMDTRSILMVFPCQTWNHNFCCH